MYNLYIVKNILVIFFQLLREAASLSQDTIYKKLIGLISIMREKLRNSWRTGVSENLI